MVIRIFHAVNAAVFIGTGKLPQLGLEVEQARNAFDFQCQYETARDQDTVNLMGRLLFLNEYVVDEVMRQREIDFVPKGVDAQFAVVTGSDAAEFFGPVGELGMDG